MDDMLGCVRMLLSANERWLICLFVYIISQHPYCLHHCYMLLYLIVVDGQLFAGTVADVSARDALVYRRSIRTEQHDSQWLNGII